MKNENNIITFTDPLDFSNYLKNIRFIKRLGRGAEGTTYLSSDNLVYKIMNDYYEQFSKPIYKLDEIITTKDINLQHFLFPIELYAIDKRLIGYQTKYIKTNLFDLETGINEYKNIHKINFDKLLNAYYKMVKDIEKLSEEKILIEDLLYNLMFTGTKLIGIDTCGYNRVDYNTFEENKTYLEDSLKETFETWLRTNNNINREEFMPLYEEQDIDKYVKCLTKITKKYK